MFEGAHQVSVKVFSQENPADVTQFVPVFHQWIQRKQVPEATIDVADYSHVWQGPGVLLVCHEANYGIDLSEGRTGLLYRCKRADTEAVPPQGDGLAGFLRMGLIRALGACARLEREGHLKFNYNEILLGVDNRLLAPNNHESFCRLAQACKPILADIYGTAFGDAAVAFEHASSADPRQPLRMRALIKTARPDVDVGAWVDKLQVIE